MKRLPDRYYDLVLEKDQLLEEAEDAMNNNDIPEYVNLKLKVHMIESELYQLEQEFKSNNKEKKYYIITREVYDIENDDFYSFMNEYSSVAEAMVEFAIQVRELKEAFTTYKEIYETDDIFFIRDEVETVSLAIHEIIAEQ